MISDDRFSNPAKDEIILAWANKYNLIASIPDLKRAYAAILEKEKQAVIEECAIIADDFADNEQKQYDSGNSALSYRHVQAHRGAAYFIADKIRALKSKPL